MRQLLLSLYKDNCIKKIILLLLISSCALVAAPFSASTPYGYKEYQSLIQLRKKLNASDSWAERHFILASHYPVSMLVGMAAGLGALYKGISNESTPGKVFISLCAMLYYGYKLPYWFHKLEIQDAVIYTLPEPQENLPVINNTLQSNG